jgi:hypothetical protein
VLPATGADNDGERDYGARVLKKATGLSRSSSEKSKKTVEVNRPKPPLEDTTGRHFLKLDTLLLVLLSETKEKRKKQHKYKPP